MFHELEGQDGQGWTRTQATHLIGGFSAPQVQHQNDSHNEQQLYIKLGFELIWMNQLQEWHIQKVSMIFNIFKIQRCFHPLWHSKDSIIRSWKSPQTKTYCHPALKAFVGEDLATAVDEFRPLEFVRRSQPEPVTGVLSKSVLPELSLCTPWWWLVPLNPGTWLATGLRKKPNLTSAEPKMTEWFLRLVSTRTLKFCMKQWLYLAYSQVSKEKIPVCNICRCSML